MTRTAIALFRVLPTCMYRGRVLPSARGISRKALPPLRGLRGEQTRVHGRFPQLCACALCPHGAHAHTHTTLPLLSHMQTDIVEKYIESQLLQRVPGFTMAGFQLSLK